MADRRVHPRLTGKDGVLAFHRKMYGPIVDIGPEGLSFQFRARCRLQPSPGTEGLRPMMRERVDIVSVGDDFILTDLPVAAAADYYSSDPRQPELTLCRRCLQFGDLLPHQVAGIEKFLQIIKRSPAFDWRQAPENEAGGYYARHRSQEGSNL